jgi:hypothetical protein
LPGEIHSHFDGFRWKLLQFVLYCADPNPSDAAIRHVGVR